MSCRRKTTCRLCRSNKLTNVLTLAPTPPANAFCKEGFGHQDRLYPLDLFLCSTCGHVQLGAVVDPETLYRDYVYVSGTSKVFVKHFEDYANAMIDRYSLEPGDLVVEIGSNDGTLLRFFQKHGCEVIGFDPARKIAEEANAKGVYTCPEFFTEREAQIVRDGFPDGAKLVLANNVFAHADDLDGIVKGVKTLLHEEGVFVFEVQYLRDLIEKNLFDMCLPPEHPIITREGLKPISAISIGTEVLTHRGRFRKVTKVFERDYVGPMRNIQVYGQTDPLRVTPEHPVYVRRGLGEFLPAREVVEGDRVLKPGLTERKKTPWLRITTPLPGHGKRETTTRFRVDRDLMRVFGYYIAEGFYSTVGKSAGKASACAEFAFGKSKKEKVLAEDCAARIRRIGATGTVRKTKFGWHVNTYGPFARLLHRELGTGAASKAVPPWVFPLGANLVRELLEGYVLGDGYVYRNGAYWRASTVSAQLAQDIALLANKLGYAVSVNRSQRVWEARIIANNPRPTLTTLPVHDILIRLKPQRGNKVAFKAGYQHATVRSIKDEAYAGKVYNLEVEEDHTYVTPQGAVHNCYHEHLSYHALGPLADFFDARNMTLFDVDRVDTHGGSIRCHVEMGETSCTTSVTQLCNQEENAGLFTTETYKQLDRRIAQAGANLKDHLHQLAWARLNGNSNAPLVVGYGAPAKATTLMHQFGLGLGDLAYIVDDSPWKQGLYTPGLHVPVVSFQRMLADRPDVVVILAWNFAASICDRIKVEFLKLGIIPPHCVVPLPTLLVDP